MTLPTEKIISCFYDSAGDCVKVLDTSATLLAFNPKGYEIMEIDEPKDVLGSNWISFWEGEMKPKAEEAFANALEGKLGYFEGFCPTMKGSPRWWQVTIAPLHNEYNEIQWLLAISRDVSELKQLREENEKLKAQIAKTR